MLELIGIVVVVWVIWRLFRAMLGGAVKGHMFRSIDYATSRGVPYEFAKKMIGERELMNKCVKHLSTLEPDLRMEDAYVQYGRALMMLWEGYKQEKGLS